MAVGATVSFEGDPNRAGDVTQRLFGSQSLEYDPFARYRASAAAFGAANQPQTPAELTRAASGFSRDIQQPGKGPAPAALSATDVKGRIDKAREVIGGSVGVLTTVFPKVFAAIALATIAADVVDRFGDTLRLQEQLLARAKDQGIDVDTTGFRGEVATAAVTGLAATVVESAYQIVGDPLVRIASGLGLTDTTREEALTNVQNYSQLIANVGKGYTISAAQQVAAAAAARVAYKDRRELVRLTSSAQLSEYDIPPRLLARDPNLEMIAVSSAQAAGVAAGVRARDAVAQSPSSGISPQ